MSLIGIASNLSKQSLVDIEVFVSGHKVIESLQQGNCSEALKWCQENKARLRKIEVRNDLVSVYNINGLNRVTLNFRLEFKSFLISSRTERPLKPFNTHERTCQVALSPTCLCCSKLWRL